MPRHQKPWLPTFPRLAALWLAGGSLFVLASAAMAQGVTEAREDFLRGHYAEVISNATDEIAAGDNSGAWRILLVKSLLATGRYAEAHTNALAALENFTSTGALEKRLLARETSLFQDDRDGARVQLLDLKERIELRYAQLQRTEPVSLGRALLLLNVEPRLVLDNCFRPAENATPPVREAFLATGELALDKHDFALAADALRAGLKKFPDDPELNAGLARAFEPGDRAEMLKAIEAALAVNSNNVPCRLLLADHLIDAEQFDEAAQQLDLALKVNPHHPEALAYRAVLAHLRNDKAGEKKFRNDALAFWKTNPRVDQLIGKKLAQKYLFAEGAAAQKRALEFDPTFLPAQRELAQDLLRLGQDDEGWKLAQAVHTRDNYDVGIYNLVTLHDQMVKYRSLTNADFIVRMAPHEADIYGAAALDLLTQAKTTLCRKYGIELKQRTTVDIFPKQKDFAVRTFGMPGNPGYLGVCFGSVITANSPASQLPEPANWKDVLWHEFCHVVTLNATKNRMPRWLSEGISVYEERQADPRWGERMDLAYREMILSGELTPLSKLSGAFLAPKNGEHLQFAYFESSLVVEFLVQQYGLETLKKILNDLGEGKEINTVIAARTMPIPDLEKKFADYAHDLAKNLAPGVDLEKPPGESSDAEVSVWKLAHPGNYFVRLDQAKKFLKATNWSAAKPVLASLASDYAGEHRANNPLWMLAACERHLGGTNAELATLQKFFAHESDFPDLNLRLIELSRLRKDWPAVTKYAQQLLAVNPFLTAPYAALAEAGAASGAGDVAIDANRKLLLLDPPDPVEVHFQLARLLHARGGSEAEAKRHVLQALEEAPRFRDAQRLLLEMTANSPQPKAGVPASGKGKSK